MRYCRPILIAFLCFVGSVHAALPMVATEPAKFVDAYRVHLVGTVTPHVYDATAWFEYGTTKMYGSKTAVTVVSTAINLDVAVLNLKEQTTYHFRIVAKNAAGTVYGNDATFMTTTALPVGIDVQPASPYVLTGLGHTDVTLAITGHGSSAKYQWLRSNVAIPLAVYETYKLPKITTTLAGTYTCRVSNPKSNLVSDPVVVAVATVNPSSSFTVDEDGLFNLTAAITPANATATFAWSTPSNPTLTGIGTVAGGALAKLSITHATAAAQDSYRCEIVSNGQSITVGPVFVAVRLKPTITQILPRVYEVGQEVKLPVTVFNSPTSVTVTGLPPGLAYNAPQRAIIGRPLVGRVNAWTALATARNLAGVGKTMSFLVNVDPIDAPVKTTFNGLVERSASPPGNGNYGGALTGLVITATGTFTGKIVLPSDVLPANGKRVLPATTLAFSGQLQTAPSTDPAATVTISRTPPLKNLTFAFTIDRANGHLTGTLGEEGSANMANVGAWGNSYSAAHTSTSLAALHNFWLNPPVGITAGAAPEGAGIGTATVNNLGAVALSLKLADGSVVTSATTIGPSGEVPVHAMLYASHGSVHGSLAVTNQDAPAFNAVTGSLTWNKTAAAGTADHSYVPSGFDFGVANAGNSLTAVGGEQRAQSGLILWGLPDVALTAVNVKMTFSGGGIGTAVLAADANETFRLSKLYKAVASQPNPTSETLVVNGSTGAFNGQFFLSDGMPAVSRKVLFQGVIAPRQRKGRGFFTLVEMPVAPLNLTNSPVQSGAVDFEAITPMQGLE
ncbi:MAG: hypothetical protein JWO08_2280 [Verrucomicrobiaceae bacterium]|nr:hypothetical protein [Verrucomicrobiaceae bacterium]